MGEVTARYALRSGTARGPASPNHRSAIASCIPSTGAVSRSVDLPPVLLPTIDDDSPTPLLSPRPKLSSTHQRQGSRSPIVVTGVIALIVLLIWGLSDPSWVTASPDTT